MANIGKNLQVRTGRLRLQASFHMIADDRKESCFHVIADDRKRSQSRLMHTFRNYTHLQVLLAKKSQQQNGGRRGRNFAASKFILLLVNRF